MPTKNTFDAAREVVRKVQAWINENQPEPNKGSYGDPDTGCVCWFGAGMLAHGQDPFDEYQVPEDWDQPIMDISGLFTNATEHFDSTLDFNETSEWILKELDRLEQENA